MNKYDQALLDISEKFRNATTKDEKDALRREYFRTVQNAFNDEIAGDVTTADGQVITIPTI